jgi:DNA-binding HxlR family transcriptional regulator
VNKYCHVQTLLMKQAKIQVRKTPLKQDCPMEVTLNVISGKWKPAIISALLRAPQRPKDLQQGLPEAAKRVIAQQLRQLENDGVISKKVYDEIPLKVEYFLTATGRSLLPVIKALNKWGDAYRAKKSFPGK